MKDEVKSETEHIEGALEAAGMAWWSLEFPSGALKFSRYKTDTLGYEAKDFLHFTHFTDLIHPDDKDAAMKAMTDHYTGKKGVYEVTYRIRAKDGKYKKFFDKGKIVERFGEAFTVAGVVTEVK
jgi:PAS domain S-box-containing protein